MDRPVGGAPLAVVEGIRTKLERTDAGGGPERPSPGLSHREPGPCAFEHDSLPPPRMLVAGRG